MSVSVSQWSMYLHKDGRGLVLKYKGERDWKGILIELQKWY